MIIIVGGSHHNTLSLIRAFGEIGISPDLILVDSHPKDSFVLASKYINHYYTCATEDEALKVLDKKYRDINGTKSVIAASDGIASLMDLHYDKLKDSFRFFNCGKQGSLTYCMNKLVQVEMAKECGIDVPVSKEFCIDNSNVDFPVFPCIIKPLKSILGGKNISVCKTLTDLQLAISKFHCGDKVLIQEFIEKNNEIVIDGVSINEQVIIPGFIRKIREHLGGTDFSSVHSISKLSEEITKKLIALVKKMNYQGLFGVEMICKDNKYYFIEINLRNDATTYSLACGGVNLPLIYSIPSIAKDEMAKDVKDIQSMVEIRDFRDAVLHRKISIKQWIKDLKESECKFYYSKDDPKPFYQACKNMIKELTKKIMHV